MDVRLERTRVEDKFGSQNQLFEALKRTYKEKVVYSALRSIVLSYLATTVKALINALWWLARGPYDAVKVTSQGVAAGSRSYIWWVSPLVYGTAEGTYRAMAELVGNTIFAIVLLLNMIRQLVLGLPRARANSLLDGLALGFRGLILDTFFTPTRQLVLQTQMAYQDWGIVTAVIRCCLYLVLVPLGPPLGALHFVAACFEGLANILLHEEAQFAPFEPQRTVESISTGLSLGDRSLEGRTISRGASAFEDSVAPAQSIEGSRRWTLVTMFRESRRLLTRATDDDHVMDGFVKVTQLASPTT
jgi:hypothetical protein